MIDIKDLISGNAPKKTGLSVSIEANWWLGATAFGEQMPLKSNFSIDLIDNTFFNQGQPLLISAHGDVIWTENTFALNVDNNDLVFSQNSAEFIQHKAGVTLKEAYGFASKTYFPPTGDMPDELLFSHPQYNTWIELMYDQNEDDILRYAQNILDQGLPPGVLMIDDNWQEDYGLWNFHSQRFTDPKAMVEKLHQMGFKVMLWVAPFVSPDSQVYRSLAKQGAFLLRSHEEDSLPQMVDWWNGVSAVLDFSVPLAVKWFKEQLDRLQQDYGIDGFKFDAGDAHFYQYGVSKENITANQQSELFAKIGLDYPLNELRATWKMGGQAIAQRLKDKNHDWQDLAKLVPQMCLEGLMGYPFACPDMIGGGEYLCFLDSAEVDQELIVRSAQAHALMPMMQFSVAPWRVLDQKHMLAVQQVVKIREKFSDYIVALAKQSAITGEPIMKVMEYDFPHQGYHEIKDQFLMGADLLIAPVVTENTRERDVILPKGRWQDCKGIIHQGPVKLVEEVALDDLLYYQRISEAS